MKLWNDNKMVLAPFAALILWIVSVLCFVYGLSFEHPIGYTIYGIDVYIIIAFGLSIANTIIQLIGNGQDASKMDAVFRIGWIGSYVLGISSNVNALLTVLGISSPLLEWGVAVSLGSMIEIMPEKLILQYFRSADNKPKFPQRPQGKPTFPFRPPTVPPKPWQGPKPPLGRFDDGQKHTIGDKSFPFREYTKEDRGERG